MILFNLRKLYIHYIYVCVYIIYMYIFIYYINDKLLSINNNKMRKGHLER